MGIIRKVVSDEEVTDLLSQKPKKVKKESTKAHYVDNEKLYDAFLRFYNKKQEWLSQNKGIPPLDNEIGEAILKISKNLTYLYKFINYTNNYKEEMIDDAIVACVAYSHNFDPIKYKNPHAYITKLAINGIIDRIKREKKNQYIKYKAYDRFKGFNADFDQEFEIDDVELINETNEMYSDYLEFIGDYELMLEEKKKKNKVETEVIKPNTINIMDFL